MWGKLPGYDWWPGVLLSYSDSTNGVKKEAEELSDDECDGGVVVRVWVKWYGDNQLSQVMKEGGERRVEGQGEREERRNEWEKDARGERGERERL